jgi:4-methyl-5(b-hydroxyethyl)-thiazole monophosphate biosynthesis
MIYFFLATGFEDIEMIAPLDIVRRAGIEAQTVSITGEKVVTSAHGVGFVADVLLEEIDFSQADMLVLPGGLPGATNLDACQPLCEVIMKHYRAGKKLAAICAAPMVYGHLGILDGIKATCYPGFETELAGAEYTAAVCQQDGQFITACGPGAAMEFGYIITQAMGKTTEAAALREGMMYNKLLR